MITDPSLKMHKGIYWTEWRGRYPFHFAKTVCTGEVWLNTTSVTRRVTCKKCRRKLGLRTSDDHKETP